MENFLVYLRDGLLVLLFVAGAAIPILSLVWIARMILAPIDRAAKPRGAQVSFSIGDFLCLFLAIQLPLAIIYRFVREGAEGAYWALTGITWFIAPVIWFACARTLSRAQVTSSRDRFAFLGLVMPLVYYGTIPFMALGVGICVAVFKDVGTPLQTLFIAWVTLALAFYFSGWFVRSMLRRDSGEVPLKSNQDNEREALAAAMLDGPAQLKLPRAHGS